jgi:tRNA 2-(methylsulfanyl)-N6-isopentenyladenosine37 hydroxylase
VQLKVATPNSWFQLAANQVDLLLIDHAHCEKKAASFGMGIIYRYLDRPQLLLQLSPVVREELLHFEQVLALLIERSIPFRTLPSCGYMAALRSHVRTTEPGHLIDLLLIAAIIEARSCERFSGLVNVLDAQLAQYYAKLHRAEARHAQMYVDLALEVGQESGEDIVARLDFLLTHEAVYLSQKDATFRFHSGIPSEEEIVNYES